MAKEKFSQSDGEYCIATISEEEENYVRMSFLLFKISPRAVRSIFDREFDPSCLDATLQTNLNKLTDLQYRRIIHQTQWNLLFPFNGRPDSNLFDVTLMITLLVNLARFSLYNKLPLTKDVSPSADLGRIKYYRNQISHNKDATMDTTSFSTAWDDIVEAVGRLGGQNMLDECKELRTKILEQSTVPWNRRVQNIQILETWRIHNSTFVETRATKHVLKCVQENSCVTITASPGVGKTATLRHVALKMADEGYNVLIVLNIQDIVKFYNPKQKTLFIMDDFCGTYSIDQSELNNRVSVTERIEEIIKNKLTKIFVACRLQVYQDRKFQSLPIFRTCVCNLLSKDLCLTPTEKMSIAGLYLGTKTTEIKKYCHLYDCFPLICKLYSENPEPDIKAFFKDPFSIYKTEIDKFRENRINGKYCALALCVMFNNRLKEEWLTDEISPGIRSMIENTYEACRLDRGTSRLIILDELKTLEFSFIKREQGVFKTIHDKIFDFLSSYFGQNMIQCLIKHANCLVIMQRFLLKRTNDMDKFITVVPLKFHMMYIQRMIDDWSIGRVQCVFININMKTKEFRERFLCCLKALDITLQSKLALTCDVYNKDTVLFQCCYLGDIPLTHWCIHHGVDVNQFSRSARFAPLHISAHEGHPDIVKVLLDNNAEIDKCNDDGSSPLFFACRNNHIEIVKLLLNNKADINKCRDDGSSPFCIACQNNHTETVRVLLDNKADINKCRVDKSSPLMIACYQNHIETVEILLDNKADIDKSDTNGASPLYVACQENNIETVKVLLDNKANIDKCRENGSSPLFVACQTNHIEIVKVLLDNKADINKCMNDGVSPLYVACENNHIEIVKLLLDNEANINKSTDKGSSPLFIACQQNHIEIVKILLDNMADINMSIHSGASPLYIACAKNHIETIKVLLNNKADINKCGDNGSSPLYVACQENHIEIVNVLLDNMAEINKSIHSGASPLYIACGNNHIEIVKLLLDNEADINKSRDKGSSPLFVACHGNHIEIVKILLNYNADINNCRDNGSSPLHIASQRNHVGTVKVLLDNKADIDKCDNDGQSPLFVACQHNNLETVKVLLDNKADIDKSEKNGASPLYIACQENHIETVKVLLDNKANIDKCRKDGASPLYVACQKNNIETVKVLLDNKADIIASMDNGSSPLYVACQRNHVGTVKLLLDNKAYIDKFDNDGKSPLFVACQHNNLETVKVLLDNKADINKCTDNGSSPLFIACQENHIELVQLLLDNKADVDKCRHTGESPLAVACHKNNKEIIRIMLENGSNYTACSIDGLSPIDIARKMKHRYVINMINEHSRQNMPEETPNKKTKLDTTPQRRSTRKSLSNDQLYFSSTKARRIFPSKKNKSRVLSTSQKRSPGKIITNDKSGISSTTPKKGSPRKKLKNDQVVKLVENASFTVNSKELRKIVLKAKGEKNTGSYLVSKLMDLVFTREEMGLSRCQGLRPAKSGDTRLPLDAEKIKTVKAYSEGCCQKNGRKQATNAEMNRAISQAVAYSRKKLKKQLTQNI